MQVEVGSINKKLRRTKRTLKDDDNFTVKLDRLSVRNQNLVAV